MKALGFGSMFLPTEALLPLLVLAGLFWTLSLRKLATSLIGIVLIGAASPLFEGLFSAMPGWFFVLFLAGLLLAFAGRFLRDVLAHACGDLLAGGIRAVFGSRLGLAALAASIAGIWLWLR